MDLMTILLTLLAIAIVYWWFSRHDPRLPPCPCRPFPVVGHLPYLGTNLQPMFKKWRKKCGNIYSVYFGSNLMIVVNGYDVIKEVLVKHGKVTNDKPYNFLNEVSGSMNTGIFFTNGHVWKEQRSATVKILRSLGMGQNNLAERILEIAILNNQQLDSVRGNPTNISHILCKSIANITCSFLIGQGLDYEDKEFLELLRVLGSIASTAVDVGVINYFRFLKFFPFSLFFGVDKLKREFHHVSHNFAGRYIKQKGYDEFDEHALDNFIALYIQEMKTKLAQGEDTSLNEDNLTKIMIELSFAGLESTTANILWCILFMLHYPEVQEKIYQEIEREVGSERPLTMSDKHNFPILNAVILETLRLSSFTAPIVFHECNQDFQTGKFLIPKGAQIVTNLDSVHLDKQTWGHDVNTFRPERFLDDEGKVVNSDHLVLFSLGKRACPGEALAKMSLFLLIGNMLQKFKFISPCPEKPPPLKAAYRLAMYPSPFDVNIIPR